MKDRVKNEYIMRVTHDIKGHLAAIKSCLDIVSTGMVGPLNEKQQDLVQRSDHRASRCITFIKALLRLTRVRLTGELERSEFSLKNVIFNSFAAAEDRAVKGDIKLSYEVDPAIDLCYGNALLIEDTITNLLLNAVKYTPQAGNVKLDVHSRGDDIIMQISDTGIGIPAGEIDRIFDEFYRASNAKKLERDGTGLGLSMAKEVIERHGGKIWVESGNTGSIFSFSLPKDGITNPADS
jgi:signal transduction histidine kinase